MHKKRCLAMLLAVLFILGTGSTAFAASIDSDETSITFTLSPAISVSLGEPVDSAQTATAGEEYGATGLTAWDENQVSVTISEGHTVSQVRGWITADSGGWHENLHYSDDGNKWTAQDELGIKFCWGSSPGDNWLTDTDIPWLPTAEPASGNLAEDVADVNYILYFRAVTNLASTAKSGDVTLHVSVVD